MVDGLMKRRLGEFVPWASAGAAAPVTAATVTTLDRMSRRDVAPRSGRVGPRGDRASSIMTSPPLNWMIQSAVLHFLATRSPSCHPGGGRDLFPSWAPAFAGVLGF